jgi:prephenate dehydrogenase
MGISSVKIVGSGLIGTSIGLALSSKNIHVLMVDADASAASLAQSLVDPDRLFIAGHSFDVVVIATPPSAFTEVLSREVVLNPLSTFVDIFSIKTKPEVEVEAFPGLPQRFVGTHPMAGREVSGAQSARGDIFVGRTWILCPTNSTSEQSQKMATELILLCQGLPLVMSAAEHDRAMALVSHAPQVIASVLSAQLIGGEVTWRNLIGQGFKDLTRIADSDASFWKEILSENSENISKVIKEIRLELEKVEVDIVNPEKAQRVIERGNSGRELIPGKHGSSSRTYIYLHIVIDDRAGQLASIFNDCASADVNIEDVSIEHTPGQNTGLVTLSILEMNHAEFLRDFLISKGWKVHLTSK